MFQALGLGDGGWKKSVYSEQEWGENFSLTSDTSVLIEVTT
jgi:hypothetical protein